MLRLLLQLCVLPYSAALRFRNFLYNNKLLKTYKADAVVISIGNITTGGTGKTPLVIWLGKLIAKKNLPFAILTRGYKTTQDNADEPAVLAQSCKKGKVIINPNRVAAAAKAISKFNTKVLILDDGFQHHRLGRNLDIVAIDAMEPFGYTKLLPAGLLREPTSSLKRADAAILTRCDLVSEANIKEIENKITSINPKITVAKTTHCPVCIKTADDKEIEIEKLKDKKVFAFCGIGNPEAFLQTIKIAGSQLVSSSVYDDHYHYTQNDIADIAQKAIDTNADLVLTTQKDWTKINAFKKQMGRTLFGYLTIEIKFVAGEDKIIRLIENALKGTISQVDNQ